MVRIKQHIELKGDSLVAPFNAPFALRLMGTGVWIKTGRTIRTKNFSVALQHVEFFAPALQRALAATMTADQQDKTYKANIPADKEFFNYQNESTSFILRHQHTLLAEEAGLGKTPIMIAAMNSDKPRRTLIICPATLKYNWKAELETWLTFDPGAISIANGDEMEVTPVIIINYDILNRHYDVLKDIDWDMMICDEAHKLKSFSSMRTKLVFGGASEVEEEENGKMVKKMVELDGLTATREIYATATPLDRNEHLWPLLTRTDPSGLGSDWVSFAHEYCGAYSNGFGLQTKKSTNTERLGVHLRARFMIRHYADDVLDLPPMIENTIMFPLSSVIMEDTEETIRENIDILKQLASDTGFDLPEQPTTADFMNLIGETFLEQGDTMKRPEFAPVFNKMATIRKELGIAKLPLLIAHIKEQAEVYDKITVFAYHREVILALVKEFPDCVKIMGGMTAKQKHEAVTEFQTGDVKYFFGNITAAGEGVTLTKSHYQLFGEVDWNYTAMLQAKKRLHRISQTKTVNIDYLVIDESMDAIMVKKVVEKGRTVKGIFAE